MDAIPCLEKVIPMVCTCAILVGCIVAMERYQLVCSLHRPVLILVRSVSLELFVESTSLWRSLLVNSATGAVAGALALLLPVLPGLTRRALAVVAVAAANDSLFRIVRLFELDLAAKIADEQRRRRRRIGLLSVVCQHVLAAIRTSVRVSAAIEVAAVLCAQERDK